MGLLNRIILTDVSLQDQSKKDLLKITRLSAKFDIISLLSGRISISSVQLFGFNINLEKDTPDSPANFQFILDAFAPKEEKKEKSELDLRINSILIRRGKVAYNVHSAAYTPGKFNANHIQLNNIIANISLKALQSDSINASIKRMSIEEANSGFELKKLSLKLTANDQQMNVGNFQIEMPNTSLSMDTIEMKYDSLADFKDFARKVHFSFQILPSAFTLKDISAFIPAFANFKEALYIETKAHGTIDQLSCPLLKIYAGNNFELTGDATLQDLSNPQDAYIFGTLSRLYLSPNGVSFLVRNLSKDNKGTPSPILRNLGSISFDGEISGYFNDLVTYGRFRTDIGTLRTDLKISSDKEKNSFSYSGGIKTAKFKLGKMLSNNKLGDITLNMEVKGRHIPDRYPSIVLKGLVSSIDYSEYTYENITLDGEYEKGGFYGKAMLDDENAAVVINGIINTESAIPTFNFQADISRFRPNDLNLTKKYEGAEVSLKIKANFTGGSIDEMNGNINIDSLRYTSPGTDYFMDNLNITAAIQEHNRKQIMIKSPFLRGNIEGDYSYKTLPTSVINIMRKYIPTLLPAPQKEIKTQNNFQFDLYIANTNPLSDIFQIPLKIYTPSTIKGYFDDNNKRFRLEGYFPRLRYKDKFFESGMIFCETPKDRINARIRFNNRQSKGAVNVAIEAQAHNDTIEATLNWGNSSEVTYSGKLSAAAHFLRHESDEKKPKYRKKKEKKDALQTVIDIRPTHVILNDTLWEVHPAKVVLDSGKVHINDFYFSHQDRHLRINGTVSNQPTDTIRINLKDINIGYVFDIADLGVNFKGEATGPAYACGVLGAPVMNTDLRIKDFGLNDGLLGDADIHGEWHHENKAIYLDADIREKDIARTRVKGFIFPIKPTSALDLQIHAENTNLKFIHYYMSSITSDFSGRVSGNVHFYGKFKGLTMDGKVLGDANMKIDVLNTTYNIKDSILIEPGGLTFTNNRVFDTYGHQGRANGYLHYRHFKDLNYRILFDVDNMLVMNTKESPEFPFYGTVYATGNATISGNSQDGVNINVAVTTNRNSSFTYIKDYVSSATSNQFIKFIDKTPRRAIQDSVQIISEYEREQQKQEEEENETDIRLNLLVDATPDATMKIIMDPIAGDYISGRGTGNIRTEFYNKGDVRMFGNYRISQGVYKFSLQEVIRKDFNIQKGSTIDFNGDPLNASMNIKASYLVNSASLNDLMPNASDYVNQTNVRVNCIMDLTGQLTSPDIKLGLELPNERDEIQALVRNYIPTDEQMNMQILYLLSIGKFYTPENVDGTQNSNMMSSVLSSTLSGQLNNALEHIIDNNNWNIGTNFSTGEKGWTDMEFEGMLSGQLLNNRLLINGNFGYRDNPMANTNFVGDFEAEWLATRSGDIRLKAYNETNDRYYTKTNLTTQGIGIIFRKEFDKWNELLFWNRWKINRLKREQAKKKAAEEAQKEKAATTSKDK